MTQKQIQIQIKQYIFVSSQSFPLRGPIQQKLLLYLFVFFAFNDDGGNCIAARRPKLFPVNNGQIKQLPKDVFVLMKYQAFLTQTHGMERLCSI